MYKNKEYLCRKLIEMVNGLYTFTVTISFNKLNYINGEYQLYVDLDIEEVTNEIISFTYFSLDNIYKLLVNLINDKIVSAYEVM